MLLTMENIYFWNSTLQLPLEENELILKLKIQGLAFPI